MPLDFDVLVNRIIILGGYPSYERCTDFYQIGNKPYFKPRVLSASAEYKGLHRQLQCYGNKTSKWSLILRIDFEYFKFYNANKLIFCDFVSELVNTIGSGSPKLPYSNNHVLLLKFKKIVASDGYEENGIIQYSKLATEIVKLFTDMDDVINKTILKDHRFILIPYET
ncbi:MAG: hypothetical protein HUK24_01030 [Sphaerochaetaceae bacterium]|nr:hypothetical protein [Bacilli bacterium]MCF0237153.1 hypothetical protein [Sphaerochaetaceae bacterium]